MISQQTFIWDILGSDLGTFLLTMVGTIFVIGTRWGKLQGDITSIKERLAKIETMFELRLKQDRRDNLP